MLPNQASQQDREIAERINNGTIQLHELSVNSCSRKAVELCNPVALKHVYKYRISDMDPWTFVPYDRGLRICELRPRGPSLKIYRN